MVNTYTRYLLKS